MPAQAQETAVDVNFCGAATRGALTEDVETGLRLTRFRGMLHSNTGAEHPLHGASGHCWVLTNFDPATGKHSESDGYCVAIDKDGDTLVMTSSRKADGMATYDLQRGTGKWAGVQGKGTANPVSISKPTASGTYEICTRIQGNYQAAE
ncbi:MAG: hypothetical protein GY798_04050 [Hyphomicrobiales bacterium]|nr:hypothetical protein [Hyphomicrobiales bacterium]